MSPEEMKTDADVAEVAEYEMELGSEMIGSHDLMGVARFRLKNHSFSPALEF